MNKYTPGPWKRNNHSSGWTINTYARNPIAIATVNSKEENAESNANLIAAAPELLAALERLLEHAEAHNPGVIAMYQDADKARAAIAKAKDGAA